MNQPSYMVALAAEEEAEYRAQQRLAQTLSDGADDWRQAPSLVGFCHDFSDNT